MIAIAAKIVLKNQRNILDLRQRDRKNVKILTLLLACKLFEQRPSYPTLDKHLQQQSKVAHQMVSDLPLSNNIE